MDPARLVPFHALKRLVMDEGFAEALLAEGLVQLLSKLLAAATRHGLRTLYPLGHPLKR